MTLVIETDESWELASSYVTNNLKFSSLFTGVIRAIESSPRVLKTSSPQKLNAFAIDAARSIIKVSPTIKASLFQYILERGDSLNEKEVNLDALITACQPDELTLILALSLLARTIRKEINGAEFGKLSSKLSVHMLLGAEVGGAMSSVGRAQVTLLCGIRFLSYLLMSKVDINGFKEMRRRCIERNMLFDTKLEKKIFGFNHLQIAASIVSSLGFDVGKRAAFAFTSQDCTMAAPVGTIPGSNIDEILNRRAVILTTESLHSNGKFHDLDGRKKEFFPDEIALVINNTMRDLLFEGRKCIWPLVNKEEIPEIVRNKLDIKLDAPTPANNPQ